MSHVIAAHGVESTIAYLRRFEREAFKEIQKDLKNAAQPLVNEVASSFPDQPWKGRTVNWTKYGRTQRGRKPAGASGASFPRYQVAKVRRGVSADTGSSRRRTDGRYNILRIKQTNAAGSIYDLAQKTRTQGKFKKSFVDHLKSNQQGKPNSRIMHPVVNKNKHKIMKDVNKIVKGVEKRFSAEIATDGLNRHNASMRSLSQARNVLGRFGA
jgi:hypothetical protein